MSLDSCSSHRVRADEMAGTQYQYNMPVPSMVAVLSRIPQWSDRAALAKFVDRHPELMSTEAVYRLCDQVRGQATINPPVATTFERWLTSFICRVQTAPLFNIMNVRARYFED